MRKPSSDRNHLLANFEQEAYPLMDLLYSTAINLTKEPADAEDLVQETFLRAWRSFSRFQQGTNFRAWIFRILTNNYINLYNFKKRQPAKADFELSLATVAEKSKTKITNTLDLDGELRDHFDDDVNRALDRVPEHYRIALLLADVNDMSYKEISETLSCPLGTVMSRISRGRNMMAAFLKRYAHENGYASRLDR